MNIRGREGDLRGDRIAPYLGCDTVHESTCGVK